MKNKEIRLSKEFKNRTIKAISALSFFMLTYLLILLLAIVLTGLCVSIGIAIIVLKPMILTLALGLGVASFGVLILIFLLKFIFTSQKVDRSHLIEITRENEHVLFKLIEEIVEQVGTKFPKKVYMSSDVNAAVFYDSSFWSMLLPIKKNLLIGMGLVNTVTMDELRAVLSHEFGHFSQKTMKVGSYVYNVNQVIFNMLFDNASFKKLIQRWANTSGYFSIFVLASVRIIEGIQWILRRLYGIVNKSYSGLSREMEFHADEIAAGVTGYEPLKSSLLRMSLADNSYNNVLNFYDGRISENIISDNLYKDQSALIHFLAEENNLVIKNGLPDISLEAQSKFNKSRLIIKDQWASHPTTEERIKRLEKTGFSNKNDSKALANDIFSDAPALQKQITKKIFDTVAYEGKIKEITTDEFLTTYKQEAASNSFSKIYNAYYDQKNPVSFDLSEIGSDCSESDFKKLYSDERVDLVYTSIALQNDIQTLQQISDRTFSIKTFDYDGVRYKRNGAGKLIKKLKQDLEKTDDLIKQNDIEIYKYFLQLEEQQNLPRELKKLYHTFFVYDKTFDSKYEIYSQLINALQFVRVTTPYDEIKANFRNIRPKEELLKREINLLLADSTIQSEITVEAREKIEHYIAEKLNYFGGTTYFDENLDLLFAAVHNFGFMLSRKYFLLKREILNYQEKLIQNSTGL